jgi:membrane protease YdiL (CAAX protease family)
MIFSLFTDINYNLNSTTILLSVVFSFIIIFFSSILFTYLYYEEKIFENLYFKSVGIRKAVVYGIVTPIIFIITTGIILTLVGYTEENPLAEEIGKNLNPLLIILIPLFSSISEETLYRGLIHMRIENKFGFVPAVFISSSLFALAHVEYGTYLQVIVPFCFGLVLGFLIHKHQNIWSTITAHFTYNLIGLLTFLYN